MTGPPLDLDAVQAFIHITELGSFTRAAEAMQTTQAAVSLKLKRLAPRSGTMRASCWKRTSARWPCSLPRGSG